MLMFILNPPLCTKLARYIVRLSSLGPSFFPGMRPNATFNHLFLNAYIMHTYSVCLAMCTRQRRKQDNTQ